MNERKNSGRKRRVKSATKEKIRREMERKKPL
jgi:hypothetical protein